MGYDFYLPRIDRVVLIPNKTTEFDSQVSGGLFTVLKGVPAINPVAPENDPTAMNLATIELPAYLYDTDDAVVTTVDNRRYTMRDIGALEDRIETLEEVTLSLLEVDTKTFQVRDADGLDDSRVVSLLMTSKILQDLMVVKHYQMLIPLITTYHTY